MSGFDMNKINAMITNMNNMNVCGPTCQKQKKIDRLRTQYNAARNRKQNAPAEVESTRKAYFIEDKGSLYYTQFMGST